MRVLGARLLRGDEVRHVHPGPGLGALLDRGLLHEGPDGLRGVQVPGARGAGRGLAESSKLEDVEHDLALVRLPGLCRGRVAHEEGGHAVPHVRQREPEGLHDVLVRLGVRDVEGVLEVGVAVMEELSDGLLAVLQGDGYQFRPQVPRPRLDLVQDVVHHGRDAKVDGGAVAEYALREVSRVRNILGFAPLKPCMYTCQCLVKDGHGLYARERGGGGKLTS